MRGDAVSSTARWNYFCAVHSAMVLVNVLSRRPVILGRGLVDLRHLLIASRFVDAAEWVAAGFRSVSCDVTGFVVWHFFSLTARFILTTAANLHSGLVDDECVPARGHKPRHASVGQNERHSRCQCLYA